MAQKIETLTIAQPNANSMRNKVSEIRHILKSYSEKGNKLILLVNDSRLNDSDSPVFRGHYLIRRDHHTNSHYPGGVVAIIPKSIRTYELQPFQNLQIETLGFEVEFGGERIRVVTSYPHPGQQPHEDFYNLLVDGLHDSSCIVMGDLNVHLGILDDGQQMSRAGETLLNKFSSKGFGLLNRAIPTYYSASNDSYAEILDLCFIKKGRSRLRQHWTSLPGMILSDHELTILELSTTSTNIVK